MELVPDPTSDRLPAIVKDGDDVRLAPAVMFLPVTVDASAPTLADLERAVPVGYLTDPQTFGR